MREPNVTLTLSEYKDLIMQSARIGADMAMIKLGEIRDEISQRQAFAEFGEKRVRKWFADGLIHRENGNGMRSTIHYSRIELQSIKIAQDKRPI